MHRNYDYGYARIYKLLSSQLTLCCTSSFTQMNTLFRKHNKQGIHQRTYYRNFIITGLRLKAKFKILMNVFKIKLWYQILLIHLYLEEITTEIMRPHIFILCIQCLVGYIYQFHLKLQNHIQYSVKYGSNTLGKNTFIAIFLRAVCSFYQKKM